MEDDFAPCKLIAYNDGGYGLILSDAHFTHYDVFEEAGREGNGYDWSGVVAVLVGEQWPALVARVSYHSEAGMFVARSDDRAALREIAQLIRRVMQDKALLRETVRKAELD
jgi:Immunity protein 51